MFCCGDFGLVDDDRVDVRQLVHESFISICYLVSPGNVVTIIKRTAHSQIILLKYVMLIRGSKKCLFSGTFPGQSNYFPGQSIQDLKVINQDTWKKAYHIYSMYDQLMTHL